VPKTSSLLDKTICCEVGSAGSTLSAVLISVFDVFHKSVSGKYLFKTQI
jgi:hypothetical protein